jgi:small multidrug resistance pump
MNAWLLLGLCIAMEVVATSLLKASNGFSKPMLGWASIAFYTACIWIMSFVLTKIPVGITYAIWSGLGIVGIAVVGWLAFKQPLTLMQIGCIALILVGAIGLNLTVKQA